MRRGTFQAVRNPDSRKFASTVHDAAALDLAVKVVAADTLALSLLISITS